MKGFTIHKDGQRPGRWKVAYKLPDGGRSNTTVAGSYRNAKNVLDSKINAYSSGSEFAKQQKVVREWRRYRKPLDERCLYLMKDSALGCYKIGIAANPAVREKTLNAERPSVKMVGKWNRLAYMEPDLHREYASQRLRGEWFNLEPAQVRYLCHRLTKIERAR